MKKAFLVGISAALVLSALSACGGTDPAPQQEETDPVEAVTQEPAAEPVEDTAPVELPVLTDDELIAEFEKVYSEYVDQDLDEEAKWQFATFQIQENAWMTGKEVPTDYAEKFTVWLDGQKSDIPENTTPPDNSYYEPGQESTGTGMVPIAVEGSDSGVIYENTNIVDDGTTGTSTTFPGHMLTSEEIATGIEDPYDTIYKPIS